MRMVGKWPAVIEAYDAATRMYTISMPGKTDGADELLQAEAEYALGDQSEQTEVRIELGSRVWVEFLAGDPRYPIITGYRQKNVGNTTGKRYWRQDIIELSADTEFKAHAGQTALIEAGESVTLKVGASTLVLTGDSLTVTTPQTHFTTNLATFSALVQVAGMLSANGGLAVIPGAGGGAGASIQGGVSVTDGGIDVTGGDIKTDGDVKAGTISVKHHGHSDPQGGSVGAPT